MNRWDGVISAGIELAERGYLPDLVIRAAIRSLCQRRLANPLDGQADKYFASLRDGPIALLPEAANSQHYELPPEFFHIVLGPQRKYSCCLWAQDAITLADAEDASLAETAAHADLQDGQLILELGCGWGSLSLWMAERYPSSRIVAVSNSSAQQATIRAAANERGLVNLVVMKADMNDFNPAVNGLAANEFDRVVSVEMFEHMRNYERLLGRIAGWLHPDGKLFVHLFCHRELNYAFDVEGPTNWMGKHFFSGGMMPSVSLLHSFDGDLEVAREWRWNGQHYSRTALAWLENLDRHRAQVLPILRHTYGRSNGMRWLQRWRIFFLAVAELFAVHSGSEWFVAHYLMERTSTRKRSLATVQ